MTEEFIVPDGATEQEGVLKDDGQPGPEGLQRQLGDVDVVNHNPPCETRKTKVLVSFLFKKLKTVLEYRQINVLSVKYVKSLISPSFITEA